MCKQVKPIEQFALCKTTADWHATTCRPCAVERSRQWRKKYPEKMRAHSYAQYLRDKQKPDDERLKYSRAYFARHRERANARTRAWAKANRKRITRSQVESIKRRRKLDPVFDFACKIKGKIRLLLRGYTKSSPAEQLLGCKIAELRKYLEMQFEPWMSWDNYGHGEGKWEIDHKMPVAAFDLSDPDQQKLCWHYTNLQPLCCKKNNEKRDYYDPAALNKLKEKLWVE